MQATIDKFHPSRKLFLLLGLFLLFLGAASVVQVAILAAFADMHSMIDIIKLNDLSSPNIIKGMKIAQGVSAILTFIIPALLFAWMSSEKKFGYLKMNQPFRPVVGLTVILLVFAAMPVINWAGELNSHLTLPAFMSEIENWMKTSEENLKKLTEAFLKMNDITDLVVNIIVVGLLAAVGEELLFRGAMQNVFLEWMKNKHAAVWVTAIIFSALHAQFYGFVPRMLLGVILGYLYIWSGSLWIPMLFHFMNNAMAVFFSYLIGKETITKEAETIGSGESPFYFVLVSVVATAGLLHFVYKNRLKETTSTEVPSQE